MKRLIVRPVGGGGSDDAAVEDSPPPQVSSTTPANNATRVAVMQRWRRVHCGEVCLWLFAGGSMLLLTKPCLAC
jgi:hypothetical protein